jgi:Domain of unknown function (DUF4381)
MDPDQYSLNNLRDIVIPDAPSFWPPAPGLWIALAVVVALVFLVGWHLRENRQRNAYRKAGLLLLGDARSSHDVAVVLKRVALAVFPREQVASLYGDAWVAFLHRTCPRRYFSAMLTSDANDEPDDELVELAGTWIRHHRVPETQAAATVT